MSVLVIKSKEVMKILLRHIHQTGEVRDKLGASVLMLCGRTVHTHAPCPPKGERATLLLESSFCKHSFWCRGCTIPRTGLKSFSSKRIPRTNQEGKQRVPVCILSSRMSCVVNAERTRQRGLLKKKNLRRVKIDIS